MTVQLFIQLNEQLVPYVIFHYAISLHMHSPFSVGFQSDQVFTCTLGQIRKGMNHSFKSDQNVMNLQ